MVAWSQDQNPWGNKGSNTRKRWKVCYDEVTTKASADPLELLELEYLNWDMRTKNLHNCIIKMHATSRKRSDLRIAVYRRGQLLEGETKVDSADYSSVGELVLVTYINRI